MRTLRVVGINEDGSIVLEDAGRRERYTVAADEQLRAAARGDLTRFGQIAIELESQLRPREIQARIRAGASVEQVAAAAGVPVQKIDRFAYPVLLERSRTAEVAQRAHPIRADGPDARVLGEVVAHTFGLRGQEYTEADWDSWKGEDGKWVVALSWRAGRSDNRAHWTFHPGAHGGTVSALDEHASDLVEGLPARPLRTVGPVIDIARTEEEPAVEAPPEELRAAASDSTVRSPGGGMRIDTSRDRQQRTATPPAQRQGEPRTEPRVEARQESRPERTGGQRTAATSRAIEQRPADPRAAGQQATGQRTAERQAAAAQTTETRAAEPQATAPRTPEAPAPEPQAAASQAAAPQAAAPQTAEPQATEPQAEPAAATEAEPAAAAPAETPATSNRRTKKGKPVMPSWDEVLLGVRGQR